MVHVLVVLPQAVYIATPIHREQAHETFSRTKYKDWCASRKADACHTVQLLLYILEEQQIVT